MKNFIKTAILAILFLPRIWCSIYSISDERVRELDITPVLGRGYSIMTNQYHSTCLMVEETTVPSFNYEYDFYLHTKESLEQETSNASSSTSKTKIKAGWFSLSVTKTEVKTSSSTSSKEEGKDYVVEANMRVERYYSSLKEEISPLSPSAASLLTAQDYVGFFKACGPNYVRGIRRAQEVAVYFKFKSSSSELASSFAKSIRVKKTKGSLITGGKKKTRNSSFSTSSNFKSLESSLIIKIYGWGLGLNEEGAGTLVASSLEDHEEIMKYCFRSMTVNRDAHHIGMVYGIEVYPWAHNTSFQANARLSTEVIEIPVPRSLIPKATNNKDSTAWDNANVSTRAKFVCKSAELKKDKFGYCCEVDQLYNYVDETYPGATANELTSICRPIRALDPTIIKDNMSNNAEFVARVDNALRHKLYVLATLEKCITTAKAIPTRFDNYVLKAKDPVQMNSLLDRKITLKHLKMIIDPWDDYRFVRHMSQELDEWIDMFYEPCFAALFGTNIGTSPETDTSLFMAYPWYSHSECMHLTCLMTNMRWDRTNGGCILGLMNGIVSEGYGNSDPSKCSKDISVYNDESCKYTESKLKNYRDSVVNCLSEIQTATGYTPYPHYVINHFCMPEITDMTATPFSDCNAQSPQPYHE